MASRNSNRLKTMNTCPNCGSPAITPDQPGRRIYYECGSYTRPGSDKGLYKPDDCTTRAGLREAWTIINVLHANQTDTGEAWPRAFTWLHEWEHLKPTYQDAGKAKALSTPTPQTMKEREMLNSLELLVNQDDPPAHWDKFIKNLKNNPEQLAGLLKEAKEEP